MIHILCFGDSNTYGYRPDHRGRYDEKTRWTALLQEKLGSEYQIIEEGLCGRTTVFQDELRQGRRGIDAIGTVVESHNPVDILIVMLGTNDCKSSYGASAGMIAKGLRQVIHKAKKYAVQPMKVLIISPIHLGHGVGDADYDPEYGVQSEEVSRELAQEYEKVAKELGASFLDAASVAKASEMDREHMDEEGHKELSQSVYNLIENGLPESVIS